MSDIDTYLETVPSAYKKELERIRKIIERIAPNAVGSISYGMPAYKYKDKPLIYFGAFKNHMSIFPTPSPADSLKKQLSHYKTAKGTIQFTTDNPLPTHLIESVVHLRMAEIEALKTTRAKTR